MSDNYGFKPRSTDAETPRADREERKPAKKEKRYESSGHKCYSIFLDKECPEFVIDDILESGMIMKLEKEGFRLRIGIPELNGPDHSRLVQETLRRQFITPWKGFNDIPEDDVYCHTTDCAKSQLKKQIMVDLPDNIMPIAAAKVNILMGRSCENPSKFCVLWTPDGAETVKELSRETGYLGAVIRLCNKYQIPVYNISKASRWDLILEQTT